MNKKLIPVVNTIMKRFHHFIFLFLFSIFLTITGVAGSQSLYAEALEGATQECSIVDSKMTPGEAFDGLDGRCPADILKRQKIITVNYYSFDGKVHEGQLVIDGELEDDIKTVFKEALKIRFPIFSVIPISDRKFRKDGRWNDDLSMEANNTSAFNYRLIMGGTGLSKHATGRAIDINPFQNPYIKGDMIIPKNSSYAPEIEGTLRSDHPIVLTFLRLGWEWGGNWTSLKDYQHFEKPLNK